MQNLHYRKAFDLWQKRREEMIKESAYKLYIWWRHIDDILYPWKHDDDKELVH